MTLRTLKIAALCTPLLLMFAQSTHAQSGRTFYIDFTPGVGSNSNAGTSKTAPWKSHPYMQTGSGCTGGTTGWGGYAHQAGDHFIFKGGVTWPVACFVLSTTAGGTATAQDYYGVDLTWFTGGSFTRPKFDMANNEPTGDNVIQTGKFNSTDYITFDNIEIANQGIALAGGNNTLGCAIVAYTNSQIFIVPQNVVVENMFIHDWTSGSNFSTTTLNGQGCYGGLGGVSVFENSTLDDTHGYGFISGTKFNEDFGGGCTECKVVSGVTFKNQWFGCVYVQTSCHDSEFSAVANTNDLCVITGGASFIHTHIIFPQGVGGPVAPVAYYNNLIHDSITPGLILQANYYDSIYNNVMWNNTNNVAIRLEVPCRSGSSNCDNASNVGHVFNNTVDCRTSQSNDPCFQIDQGHGGNALGTVYLENNVWVTDRSSAYGTLFVNTLIQGTPANNYEMGLTEASTYGFGPAGKYSPASSDPNTVGKGANLTSFGSANLTALLSDTSGAPWFGGSYKTRPTGSTNWDLGAYQFQGGTTGPPSISISSPSAGTVSSSVNLTASCTPQGSATVSSIQFTIDGFPFGAAGTSSPYTLSWNTATAANANHIIGASCTDSNAQVGTAGTVTVIVTNSIPGCFISTDNDSGALSWTANQSFTAQTANFTATLTIAPNTNHQDSVVALSESAMSAYSQGAALLRFNSSGFIDVYKGTISNYASDNSAPYTAGTAYSFSYTINFTGPNAGTYSVSETSPSSIAIATNYAFRSTALIASLGFLNAISDNTTPDTAQVCNFQVGSAASLTFSPLSLDFGNITVGANATQIIAATTSGGSVNFSSVGISGSSDVTINSNTCTGSVPSSCTTQIEFAPTSAALESATITYTDDATGSPQSVAVSGTGVPATPTLSISPTSVNFGSVQVLTSSSSGPIVLTITSGPVTFTGTPSFSGSNAADFALASNTCTGTVSASSCQTVVSFTPSLVAPESATLTYTDNATGSPQQVALTGSGYLAPHPPTTAQATVN